jgi:hypothetical protein
VDLDLHSSAHPLSLLVIIKKVSLRKQEWQQGEFFSQRRKLILDGLRSARLSGLRANAKRRQVISIATSVVIRQ